MLMRALRRVLFASTPVSLLVPAAAWADGIIWTVANLILPDGGTVSGSFVYNADTNVYFSPDVISASGSLFAGALYTSVTDVVFCVLGRFSPDDFFAFCEIGYPTRRSCVWGF